MCPFSNESLCFCSEHATDGDGPCLNLRNESRDMTQTPRALTYFHINMCPHYEYDLYLFQQLLGTGASRFFDSLLRRRLTKTSKGKVNRILGRLPKHGPSIKFLFHSFLGLLASFEDSKVMDALPQLCFDELSRQHPSRSNSK